MDGNALRLWFIVLCVGSITFMLRFSFVVWFGQREMPDVLKRALRFVPVSIFTAVMVPQVLATTGTVDVSLSNTRLWAALIALLVAWRTRNVLATVVVGMIALVVLQSLGR